MVVWKKLYNGVIAKIEVPADAKRTASLVGRKCRAEYVKTLALFGTSETSCVGARNESTIYTVGEITRPDQYDDDPRVECTYGIHFFLTREEAESY